MSKINLQVMSMVLLPLLAAISTPGAATAGNATVSSSRNSTALLPPLGANHTVGEGTGWFFDGKVNASSTNYSAWATNRTFYLGDYLSFKTNTDNTVVHTTNTTVFKLCGSEDGAAAGSSGWKTEEAFLAVMLTTEGANYFFSDAKGGEHCRKGMQFEVNVAHGRGLPPVPPCYYEPLSGAPAGSWRDRVSSLGVAVIVVILVL